MADIDHKPSFLSSVMSGIGGYIKGAIALGIIGAALGAAGGAAIGAAGFLDGAVAAATAGAVTMGLAGVGTGGILGAITGIIKSREVPQPSVEDIANVAKISLAQGISIGQQMQPAQEPEVASSKFRDKIVKERAAVTLTQGQSQSVH